MISDQLIAALASGATLVTAFATLLTVREIGRQRRASYKPDLIPTEEVVRSVANRNDPLAGFEWLEGSNKTDEMPSETRWRGIPFFNLGLGAAKFIKADWRLDLVRTTKTLNALAERSLSRVSAEYDEQSDTLYIQGERAEVWGQPYQPSQTWPYLLPAAINESKLMVPIPHFILRLYSLEFTLNSRLKGDYGWFEFEPTYPVHLQLSYTDLGGSVHKKRFLLQLEVTSVISDGESNVKELELLVKLRETG